ncbi:MAG: tRNA threonylcarbamoyladenosine dehydratase, partial [Prevotella sp.]|nr:tRNA threonylcarbamoyladenosine dehydratase [Prevotella sp.]
DSYDYIIDAIDSLKDKVTLILRSCQTGAQLFSSMGAALKLDPSRIRVAEFWKTEGDPLARALRKKFKHQQQFPEKKFLCVYSDELLPNLGKQPDTEELQLFNKPLTNGSLVHITAIFGMTLASLVVQDAAKA